MGLHEIIIAELEKIDSIKTYSCDNKGLKKPAFHQIDEFEEISLKYKTKPFKLFHISIPFIKFKLTTLQEICEILKDNRGLVPQLKQLEKKPRYLVYIRAFREAEYQWYERVRIVET